MQANEVPPTGPRYRQLARGFASSSQAPQGSDAATVEDAEVGKRVVLSNQAALVSARLLHVTTHTSVLTHNRFTFSHAAHTPCLCHNLP